MIEATVNSVTTNFVYRGDGLRDSRAVSGGATTTFTWDIASGLPVVLDDGNQYVYGAGLNAMKQGGNWVGIPLPRRKSADAPSLDSLPAFRSNAPTPPSGETP